MTNTFRQEILGAEGQGNSPSAVNAFDLFIENRKDSQTNTLGSHSKDCVIGDDELVGCADDNNMKARSHDMNKIMPSGSAIERLDTYMAIDLWRVDLDNDGHLNRAELRSRLSSNNSSEDELQLLSWMSRNMKTIEKLGDKWPDFSEPDMESLKQLEIHGTSSPAFALRDQNMFSTAVASTAVGFFSEAAIKSFLKTPISFKSSLFRSACIFGAVTLSHAFRYYFDEKPKIDSALKELDELNTVTKP